MLPLLKTITICISFAYAIFFVKADTCRWVYQKIRYTAKEISLKISCADPETFVWRAGYYRPYSGFAIEMAFRWPADCGPTLNADFEAFCTPPPLEVRMNVQQPREFHSYRRHP